MKIRLLRVYLTFLTLPLVLTATLFLFNNVTAPAQPQIQKQEGISYTSWWPGEYSTPDADLALARLAQTGASWISLIVTQYQTNISSTTIAATTATPADADLIHVITQAHSLGLQVMLKPHIDLSDDPAHWRGEIGQSFTNSAWNTWFSSYQNFINHYAQLAQTYHADQFCVGTELGASHQRETNWRAVIAGVRGYYSGPLTYAANEETTIAWWDALDFIGVDAYYPLTGKNNPTVAELEAGWQPYLTTLANLAATWSKPILFTEIGYRSIDGANQYPWDWHVSGPVDLQEQADSYQAAFTSVFTQSWFAGMYWWDWGTNPAQGGPCDDDYTPHDKPAEDVLRSWYGASPRPQPDDSQALGIYTDGLGSGWEDWSWDAAVNFSASSPVYSGTRAISVTAQAWGALSLHHTNLDSAPYDWLEFYVRKSSSGQQLVAFVNDENDAELDYVTIDDCRYTGIEAIVPGVWTRVRIPLSDLGAARKLVQRVSIKKEDAQISSFGVDEIRLIGYSRRIYPWSVYLPVVVRNR